MSNNVTTKFLEIPFDKLIIEDDKNARSKYDLAGLKANIKKKGQAQPVIVVPDDADPSKYRLLAGFSRAKAMKELGLKAVGAMVREEKDRKKQLLIQGAENLVRNDLTTYETAVLLQRLIDAGATREEIAEEYEKSQAWISNHLGLWDLPVALQDKAKDEKLTLSQIRFLHSYAKSLEPAAIERVAKDIDGKDADALSAFKAKFDAKIEALKAGTPVKGKKAAKAAKVTTEAATTLAKEAMTEAKAEAPLPRTRGEVTRIMASIQKKMEKNTNTTLRSKLIGQLEALSWVTGDELVSLD